MTRGKLKAGVLPAMAFLLPCLPVIYIYSAYIGRLGEAYLLGDSYRPWVLFKGIGIKGSVVRQIK